jgi:hypothetical protein
MSRLRRKILVGALLMIALVLPMWASFERPALSMDEGALLVYPEQVLKGKLPYRDFETFYGPANPLLLSATYATFGASVISERAAGLVYRLLILVVLFALIQRWNLSLAAGCTVIAAILMMPIGLGAFAWIGALAAVLVSIWLALRIDSGRRVFLAGLAAGIALLFRPDLAPAVCISVLPLALLMCGRQRWNYFLGLTTGSLPYLVLTIAAGAREMLNNLFLFPVLYSSPGRHLPISSAEPYVQRLLVFHLIAMTIDIVVGFLLIRRKRADVSPRLLMSLSLLALGLTHQAVQRLDFGHIAPAALVSLSILPVSFFALYRMVRESDVAWQSAIITSASVAAALLLVIPQLGIITRNNILDSLNGNARYAVFVQNGDRSFPIYSPRLAADVADVVDRLNRAASKGQRLFVGPYDLRRTNYNDTFFYHLLPQLLPATYFLEMNPRSANRPNSRLASDVASADWLVLSRLWDNWNEPNESSQFGSDAPLRVVEQKFQLCFRNAAYSIYRKRDS